MFTPEHILNLFVSQCGNRIQHPVCQSNQHPFGFFLTGYHIGIAQARIRFMDII